MDCVFCGIVTGELPSSRVYEDERVVAFMDINPATPGHVLVIPRAHAPYLADLAVGDAERMMSVAQRLAQRGTQEVRTLAPPPVRRNRSMQRVGVVVRRAMRRVRRPQQPGGITRRDAD